MKQKIKGTLLPLLSVSRPVTVLMVLTCTLVLGAIKGIGKGIALSLADAGVKVVLNYFDWEEELALLKRDLDNTGREHLILKTNLLETAAIPRMIRNVIDRFGRLDILINNIERGYIYNYAFCISFAHLRQNISLEYDCLLVC